MGAFLGIFWPSLSAVLAICLAIICWRLWRIQTQLKARRRLSPPGNSGFWNQLDRVIQRGQAEAKQRNQRLVRMLRAYRATARALPDAIGIVDRNTQKLIWFNDAASRLLGLRYPDDIDRQIGLAAPALPLAELVERSPRGEAIEIQSPLNATQTLSIRLVPYADDLWLVIARDVSRLVHLESIRQDFVANVSHELRTPLTVIHGYLDMLDPADYPEIEAVLTELGRQSTRMADLVEDLLNLSRLEDQGLKVEKQRVNMKAMMASLEHDARELSQGRHRISFINEAEADLLGSPTDLHSAFLNLVSNAIRYTPTDGGIAVSFHPSGDGAVFRVKDTGYGIAAQHLPRLTERFYRVSNSRSRGTGGTGLGLAIARHILGLHDAHLRIESEVGIGSIFSCHFDAAAVISSHTEATHSLDSVNPDDFQDDAPTDR